MKTKGDVVALPWVDLASVTKRVSGQRARSGSDPEHEDACLESPEEADRSYTEAFERVADRVKAGEKIAARDQAQAPIHFAELMGLPLEDRFERIEQDPSFASYLLCEMLLAKSREAWFQSGREALSHALLAVEVARRLEEEFHGRALCGGIRARAWAYLANAYRIASDLKSADLAMTRARSQAREAELQGVERAEILSLEVSLLVSSNSLDEAIVLSDQLLEIHRESGDDHVVGRTLLQKASMLYQRGDDPETGLQIVSKTLELLDPWREPRLQSVALQNKALFLVALDRPEEALAGLAQAQMIAKRSRDAELLTKIRWVEAHIYVDLGRFEEAIEAFLDAKRRYLAAGTDAMAAMVSLELAGLYVESGETSRVWQLANEAVPIFERTGAVFGIPAVFVLLREAAEQDAVTVELIEQLLARVKALPGERRPAPSAG